MIYVWAMEQKQGRFEKQDNFVPQKPSPPSCSSGEPCSHGVQKPILHRDKELALKQPCHKLDGTSELCRTARSTSCREKKKALCTVSEESLRWSLFSRSLDLDLGNQWDQEGLISYGNYSFELNELKRGKKVEKNPECTTFRNILLSFIMLKTEFLKYNNF